MSLPVRTMPWWGSESEHLPSQELAVADRRMSWTLKTLALLAIPAIGTALQPRAAEAQARGTLQAVATVVDTRPSFDGLRAAQAAVSSWSGAVETRRDTVQTVAQVSVEPRHTGAPEAPGSQPSALVVTVDFLRN